MKLHACFLALMIPALSAHAEGKSISIPMIEPVSTHW